MGVAYHDPVLRLGDNLFMADIGMFALHHIAGVDLIRQTLPHGPGLPLAAASQFVVIAEQAAGSMIVTGGHNAALIQPLHDHIQRNAVNRPLENLPDDGGRDLVDQQTVAVVRVLPVAVGWTRPHKLPVFHGLILLCPDLPADVGGVSLIYHIFQRHDQMIAASFGILTVKLVVDGDKPHPMEGKILLNIVPGVDGVPAKAGEVLDNDAQRSGPWCRC